MLTPREYDQIQIALFSMAKTKINGRAVVDHDHVVALLKSFTSGELILGREGDDTLTVQFTPAEETSGTKA